MRPRFVATTRDRSCQSTMVVGDLKFDEILLDVRPEFDLEINGLLRSAQPEGQVSLLL